MEPYLFEISSEAGRKVGGIYTVIKSKSAYASKHFPNRYMFIGFYDESCVHDVKFTPPPKEISKIFEELANFGIFCHYGNWIYANDLPVILVDSRQFGQRQIQYEDGGKQNHNLQSNYIKYLLWKNFQIDSLMERSYDFNENVVWGWAVGMLLERLCSAPPFKDCQKIAQFHEWICASALLYSRLKGLPIATVFTTHATVLGRSLSASGVDVLQKSQSSPSPIDLSKAYELKVEGKHQLEMAAAKKAHVFTTVSETVAQEVRYILGRYPDVIVLNGLDFSAQLNSGHVRGIGGYVREELLELSQSVFAPYEDSRYDNALLLFTSGRYEFVNKGFDIYIQALSKLNAKLKSGARKNQKQVIAFIFAPSSSRGPKLSVIKNYLLTDKIKEVLDSIEKNSSSSHAPSLKSRISKISSGAMQNDLLSMHDSLIKEGACPPISLFDLTYANDDVINTCLAAGLDNSPQNPVKVLFYPAYLKPNDGLLNMTYDDIISGMDMGVFASRYEPFGYTPLEAALKMDITVSTDSSGFGRYLQSKEDLSNRGVKILHMSSGTQDASQELSDFMLEIYSLNPVELDSKKKDAFNLMHVFDWKDLISNYMNAYDLACQRAFQSKGAQSNALISSESNALIPAESHPLTTLSQKVALAIQSPKSEGIMENSKQKSKMKKSKDKSQKNKKAAQNKKPKTKSSTKLSKQKSKSKTKTKTQTSKIKSHPKAKTHAVKKPDKKQSKSKPNKK